MVGKCGFFVIVVQVLNQIVFRDETRGIRSGGSKKTLFRFANKDGDPDGKRKSATEKSSLERKTRLTISPFFQDRVSLCPDIVEEAKLIPGN